MTLEQALAQEQERVRLLSQALADVLVHAGLLRADHGGLTGPELLTAADTFCRHAEQDEQPQRGKLKVAEAVRRDDGRWYVPVKRVNGAALGGIPGETSDIVLRVASDAFPAGETEHSYPLAAESFAHEIVERWNAVNPEQRTVKLGVIEFHSPHFNPGLIERFYAVRDDLTQAGCIVDLWLLDIATVLAEYGYDLKVTTSRERPVAGATWSTPADDSDPWMSPEWSKAGKVHDWRNHVSDSIQMLWSTFTPAQRKALYDQAEADAYAEEWE